tara:strand:- start:641 stop:811 length:171 start_codon:yes stop_codon:yes gene_type:complete
MVSEITVLEFKLRNALEEYGTYMKAPEHQAMFKEMGVKTFLYWPMQGRSKNSNRDA